MKTKRIELHLIKHMWEAYAKKFLLENPDCYGKPHNKIKNFYLYKTGTRKVKVKVNFPSRVQTFNAHSQQGLVFSYEIFRKIISEFLDKGKLAVINGEALSIPHLGKIVGKCVERDFRKKTQRMVDWGKTRQQEKVWSEELQRPVYPKYYYFSDDNWCRIGWMKPRIKNDGVYEFDPANPSSNSTGNAFKLQFKQALKADPLLKYKFLYSPIREFRFIKQPETA